MIEDSRLCVFDAVCRQGGFSRAAEALGVTQSAISQTIAELEREAGVTLFDRDAHHCTLTADGVRFKSYSDQILHWYGALRAEFSDASSGQDAALPGSSNFVSLDLGDGKSACVWGALGDIHIKIK